MRVVRCAREAWGSGYNGKGAGEGEGEVRVDGLALGEDGPQVARLESEAGVARLELHFEPIPLPIPPEDLPSPPIQFGRSRQAQHEHTLPHPPLFLAAPPHPDLLIAALPAASLHHHLLLAS